MKLDNYILYMYEHSNTQSILFITHKNDNFFTETHSVPAAHIFVHGQHFGCTLNSVVSKEGIILIKWTLEIWEAV